MKKTSQLSVTVDLECIRSVLAMVLVAEAGGGSIDPNTLSFDIGERDDGYGFPETGTTVLKGVSAVVKLDPEDRAGLVVQAETTITMDCDDVKQAIADHVSKTLEQKVVPSSVHLFIVPRHLGDYGYEGPTLERAVVTIKA